MTPCALKKAALKGTIVHKQIQVDYAGKYLMTGKCVEVSLCLLRELFLLLGIKSIGVYARQHLNWLHSSVLVHSKISVFAAKLPQWNKTMLYDVDASK